MKLKRWILALGMSVILGCQGGDFPTAPVSGVVLCEGQPVAKAMVYFQPVSTGESKVVGKQGFAFTDADGRFVIGTYGLTDGAVVGKHSVRVDGPGVKCDCVLGDEISVMDYEVTSGQKHDVKLELTKKTAAQMRKPMLVEDDDDED